MSYQSRWAAPQGPDAAQKAAQRAARFSKTCSSTSKTGASSAQQLDLLLSPSRGELAHEKSLRDPAVQSEYRAHLQGKVQQYQRRFSYEDAWDAGEAQDILRNICLDYRKLREGLLAASRTDAFAVEVYQEAIDLACYARHAPTLTTALPSLLHLYAQRPVVDALSHLSLDAQDGPALYASLHLLHLLSSTLPGSHARFWDAYRDLTLVSSAHDVYAKRQHATVNSTHPHLQLAKTAFEAIHRRHWVAFKDLKVTDHRQRLLLRALEDQMRDRAWEVLLVSYQMLPAEWLQHQLMLKDVSKLRAHLDKQGRKEVDRVVQLKLKS